MEFVGRFCGEGNKVVLEGRYCIPFIVKFWYSILYAAVIFIGAYSAYDFFINGNQQVAGALLPALGMAWWVFFVAKLKTEDALSDWKWLASSIDGALLTFNATEDDARYRNS